MLILIAILVFILIVASTWWFGLWSNLLTLINLFISSLLASSLYEPISVELENINASYKVLFDFIAVWLVFVLSFMIIRGATDALSAYRLKFDPITEIVGRSVLSVWIAGVFICFSFFTLQMAPLTPETYGSKPGEQMAGTIPDRLWLAFVQSRSRGALSAGKKDMIWPEYTLPVHPDDEGLDVRVFDPHGEFLTNAAMRRARIASSEKLRTNSAD